ncbi:hypothetical protein [Luteimonas sp. e5]
MSWDTFAQILIALSSLALSAAVYHYTRKTVAIESLRAVRDAWMQVDQSVLADAHNLRIADALFHPDAEGDEEARRKRWIIYMALNPVVSDFIAAHAGLLPDGAQVIDNCRVVLRNLLRDDDTFRATQSGAYFPPFARLCAEIRAELPAAAG